MHNITVYSWEIYLGQGAKTRSPLATNIKLQSTKWMQRKEGRKVDAEQSDGCLSPQGVLWTGPRALKVIAYPNSSGRRRISAQNPNPVLLCWINLTAPYLSELPFTTANQGWISYEQGSLIVKVDNWNNLSRFAMLASGWCSMVTKASNFLRETWAT